MLLRFKTLSIGNFYIRCKIHKQILIYIYIIAPLPCPGKNIDIYTCN